MITVTSHSRDCDSILESSCCLRILSGDGGIVRAPGLFAILTSFTDGGIFIGELTETQSRGSKVASGTELFNQGEGWVSHHVVDLEPYLLRPAKVLVGLVQHGGVECFEGGL